MPRFEYRLNDQTQDYPILYYYESMSETEIALRFCCDYLVKEGKTWLKAASGVDAAQLVVYVDPVDEDDAEAGNVSQAVSSGNIAVEVREYREGATEYPLLHQFAFDSQVKAIPYLLADTLLLLGQEWEKTSTEIDEDRQAYIYYCQKSGR